MLPTKAGSILLFRFLGIEVYLHWYWFLAAAYEIINRPRTYSSLVWNVLEYLALFGIVLMHEFGHALACRQVGGKAEQIILWPLGGVAYVAPPQRPGAMLWSIAAGPLVNVALTPVLLLLAFLGASLGWGSAWPNLQTLIETICWINVMLLVFNLLPIYPLDGGQILRSLLWFVLGRARSLLVVSVMGFPVVALLLLVAILKVRDPILGLICLFVLFTCWRGFTQARLLAKVAKIPRRPGFACPDCREQPILGPVWRCAQCRQPFDTFETRAVCPSCGAVYPTTQCLDCGAAHPIEEWGLANVAGQQG